MQCRYTFTLFFSLFFCLFVSAQQVEKDYQTLLKNATTQLGWSEDIHQKVSEIMIRYKAQTADLRKKQFNKPENRQKMMKSLQTAQRTELMDIVPMKEYREFMKLMREEQQAYQKSRQLSKEQKQALGREIQLFNRKSVFPYLAKERKALEELLDAKTKSEMNYLKDQLHALQSSMKEKQAECKALTDRDEKKKCRNGVKSIQKQMKPHRERIEVVLENVKKDPKKAKVLEDLAQKRKVWKKDLYGMAAPYYGVTPEDTASIPLDINRYLGRTMPFSFLAMDADNINLEAWEEYENLGRTLEMYFIQDDSTLSYEVLEDGPVFLEIYDTQGNLLQTVKEEKTSGVHLLPLDLQNLSTGILICRLKDGQGEVIKRFVKVE